MPVYTVAQVTDTKSCLNVAQKSSATSKIKRIRVPRMPNANSGKHYLPCFNAIVSSPPYVVSSFSWVPCTYHKGHKFEG